MSVKLSSKNLVLRRWEKTDFDSLLKYANNHNIAKNLRDRFPHPYTAEAANSWITYMIHDTPQTQFAIEVDAHAVGSIGIMPGSDVHRLTAEVGYWLAEPYWGRGLATEALKLVVDYAFKKFDFVRLFAGVFETNPASARVLEKAGFSFECRMRYSVVKEGKILDQLTYVRLRSE